MPFKLDKILIIRFSSLGDLILLVPELLRLRYAAPDAVIHLLTRERYAGLFQGNTYLDDVLTLVEGGPGKLILMRARLARERYGTIIDAHGVPRSSLLYHSLRTPKKIRIDKSEIRKFMLIAGKVNLYRGAVTQSDRYARLIAALGAEPGGGYLQMPIPPHATAAADAVLSRSAPGGRRLVAFAPGARWETKTWPPERYAEVMRETARRGFTTLLIGGAADLDRNAGIAAAVDPAPLDLTGRLSILESAAVLKRCAALVTNDSAPLHLAEAVGTPVVALFGPTVREFGYFPRLERSVALETKLGCRPCSRNGSRRCPYGTKECLAAIPSERVAETLAGIVGEREARA